MRTQHTPGPWGIEWTNETAWIGTMRKDGKVNEIVCNIEREGLKPEILALHDANAQLIVAAPSLLEACKEVRNTGVEQTEDGECSGVFITHEAWQWCADAIARATGKEPQ